MVEETEDDSPLPMVELVSWVEVELILLFVEVMDPETSVVEEPMVEFVSWVEVEEPVPLLIAEVRDTVI